jgi:hypothetical protein
MLNNSISLNLWVLNMEGNYQLTIKDWIDHLHWVIENLEHSRNHLEKFRIPILTLLIVSLFSLGTTIFTFQWLYVILSSIGIFFSTIMLHIMNRYNYHFNDISNDFSKMMNYLLTHDKINNDVIRIEYMKICSKYYPIGKLSQKRLEELKRKKAKKK